MSHNMTRSTHLRKPPVRVVEDKLHKRRVHGLPRALVQQHLPLLLAKAREPLVEQHELDGVEKVGLARAVPSDYDIVSRTKRLDFRLRPKAAKARYHHLLDMHRLFARSSFETS